jgi:hypothetical protein
VPDRYPAIEDHAVIGDLHTVAMVATDGTIDWCCMPRFDSPAVFASLLDADRGGSFAVRAEAVRTRQLYMPDSNVLVTRFLGADSVGEVVDFMVPRHPGGVLQHPGHLLVRRLRSVRGTVVFTVTCRPAFDFGRHDHVVRAPDRGGAVFTSAGARAELVLRSSHRFAVTGTAATATVTLGPGEGVDLVLDWGGRPEPPAEGRPTGCRTTPWPTGGTGCAAPGTRGATGKWWSAPRWYSSCWCTSRPERWSRRRPRRCRNRPAAPGTGTTGTPGSGMRRSACTG